LTDLLNYLSGEYSGKIRSVSGSDVSLHLAVVTNKPENITKVILDKFDILKCFEIVIGPESLTNLKPDPEGILKVLSFTDTLPAEAIMVGDTDTDIFAGRAALAKTCGRLGGLGNQEALIASKPDYIIKTLDEIIGIVG
jgi:phosphoglycolate phosphatase-like HAD superfamily hydrolase